MGQVFKVKAKNRPDLLQRIFKREPIENAFIELNNLFATRELSSISASDVNSISTRYKVDFAKKFPDQLKDLYNEYLLYCLSDHKLLENDIEELQKLKALLGLQNNEVEALQNHATSEIYKKSFEQLIKDGRLETKNKEILVQLERDLKIPKGLAKKISLESKQNFIQEFVKNITVDDRLSPTDLEELETISKSFDVELNLDAKSKAAFDKMKRYWLFENGELPIIDVDINLQKDEGCHVQIKADWHEFRSVTKRINYSGPSARIKIIKGFSYRAGSLNIERVTSEHLQRLDSGKLYLTNKRLIFTGQKKSTNIKLNKILSFTPYSDGIEITKDTGRNQIFIVPHDADVLAMILSRILNEL